MNLSQLEQENFIVQRVCRYGLMKFLRTDFWIARSLGLYGEFSESEISVWRTLVNPGDTVVSAGANVGAHVVWWSQHVGAQGRVYTAEPQELLYEILLDNLNANGCTNVTPRRAALGRDAGVASMWDQDYRFPANFGGSRIERPGEDGVENSASTGIRVEVPLITIDEMVGEADVKLIHLDVEGSEPEALAGAANTIDRCRPYLYVEIEKESETTVTVARMLAAAGYEMLIHQGPLFNPRNFAGNTMNVFGNTVSINALGVPRQ